MYDFDIISYLDNANEIIHGLSEADADDYIEHLRLEIADQPLFIKRNEVREITNPIFFDKTGIPTSDGLLSNEIFGITAETRNGTYAYIDLHGIFMDPSCYKVWSRIDPNVKACVHGTDNFIIDEHGHLVSSPSGKCGIKFLKDNFDKIKFKSTESVKRDTKIEYLKKNKDRMFITKYIIIPAGYRDVNSGKNTGVGEINKFYAQLLVSARSLLETHDYGISNESISGRMQEIILCIYDWIIGNNNIMIKDPGSGLSKKTGIIRRSVISKTADYGARLVISAPEIEVHSPKDLKVDVFHSSLPLSAALSNFKPFVIFHIRRFFENQFGGIPSMELLDKNGKITRVTPKDPLIEFSDERIDKEIENFILSYNNRIVPIIVPIEENNKTYYMQFTGHKSTEKAQDESEPFYHRPLCWVDVLYQAAVAATEGKTVLVTRFPMDTFYNQFPTEVYVSSSIKTEPLVVNGKLYDRYPYIRQEHIGMHTGNYFTDTFTMSNVQLGSIKGDYDGDMISSKGSFYVETNDELKANLYSKSFFIDLSCSNVRKSSNEAIQALYSLTKIEEGTKLTNPVF